MSKPLLLLIGIGGVFFVLPFVLVAMVLYGIYRIIIKAIPTPNKSPYKIVDGWQTI
jgi:Na+-transporting methylmalonyl-CoA/oxaloacetate decarboxylase gamma subunit